MDEDDDDDELESESEEEVEDDEADGFCFFFFFLSDLSPLAAPFALADVVDLEADETAVADAELAFRVEEVRDTLSESSSDELEGEPLLDGSFFFLLETLVEEVGLADEASDSSEVSEESDRDDDEDPEELVEEDDETFLE